MEINDIFNIWELKFQLIQKNDRENINETLSNFKILEQMITELQEASEKQIVSY